MEKDILKKEEHELHLEALFSLCQIAEKVRNGEYEAIEASTSEEENA